MTIKNLQEALTNRPINNITQDLFSDFCDYLCKYQLYLISIIFFVFLSLPIIILAVNNIEISTIYEESVGYRYFYSLRILYSNERPWLPQGQFPGLVNILIQHILTLVGRPVTELLPRVEIFSYCAAIVPLIITAIAYLWAAKPLRSLSSRILLPICILSLVYQNSPQKFFAFWNTIPDYINWILPIFIISFGITLRILRDDKYELDLIKSIYLGVFFSVIVATKLSLVIFPIAITGTLIFKSNFSLKLLAYLFLTFVVSCINCLLICWASYLCDVSSFIDSFPKLLSFLQWAQIDISITNWISELAPKNITDLRFCILLTPFCLITMGITNKNNRILLSLLPATFLALLVCYKRFYWVTMVETQFFFLYIGLLIWSNVTFNLININFHKRIPNLTMNAITFILASTTWYAEPMKSVEKIISYYELHNSTNKDLSRLIEHASGKSALLSYDNSHRIPSIHTAICKGGSNLGSYKWGDSEYITSMYNKFACHMNVQPIVNNEYSNIVFVKLSNEQLTDVIYKIQDIYKISLKEYDCSLKFPAILPEATDATLIVCTKS